MKRYLILLALTFCLSMGSCVKDTDASGQESDDEDEFTCDYDIELVEGIYKINSTDGLCAFRDLVNGYSNTSEATFNGFEGSEFGATHPTIDGVLMTNIDLAKIDSWRAIGVSSDVSFYGTFDGDEKSISNLSIDSSDDYVGLFGYIQSATIENLILYTPSVDVSSTQNIGSSGSLVGYAKSSTISRCGVVDGCVGGYTCAGGLVGSVVDTELVGCFFNGSVESLGLSAGGIVAYANSSKIVACYNTGTIAASSYVGGVVAWSEDISMIGCYNTAKTTTEDACNGSLIGCVEVELYLAACYYLDIWSVSAIGQNLIGYNEMGCIGFSTSGDGSFVEVMNSAISSAGYVDVEYTAVASGYAPSLMGESFAYPVSVD